MTHPLARYILFGLFISGWFLMATPVVAQDSSSAATTKSSASKSKRTAPTGSQEAAKDDASAAKATDADKAQPDKPDDSTRKEDARKDEPKEKKDAPPVVESPKLIEVPQDDATYTPRPKIVAIFVFTNGNRIESDDYLITKDALFINKDGQKARYPINTVDRAATKAANQGRGVDIVFPKSKSEFNLDF